MSHELMSEALERFLEVHPPVGSLPRWDEAVHDAFRLSTRSAALCDGTHLGEYFIELRKQATAELVSFHRELTVTPYRGLEVPCPDGYSLWQVDISLTLFPMRGQGFSRIECLVEFSTEVESPDAFRVLKLLPEQGAEVKARKELSGSLQLDTLKKVGLWVPLPTARLTAEVAVERYGKEGVGPLISEAVRRCAQTEVLGVTGARWRLKALAQRQMPGAESHQLSVILAVKQGTPALQAAGSLLACSDEDWLSQSVGSILLEFDSDVRRFLKSGAPAEGYGEWKDILVGPPGLS
ncbi:hypothetical protein [Pyxidicoccus trucidator]|uniref:hypothetical protein n=1 Tax=Pyxidicoccus trucidator TaxID=2709662 RepID=UPI0013DCA38E|nr:hypothetical protein [Pyxidicoccus trucidator]